MNGEPSVGDLEIAKMAGMQVQDPVETVPFGNETVKALKQAQGMLQDTSAAGAEFWRGKDEVAVAQTIREIITGNEATDILGRAVLGHFGDLLVGAAHYGMRLPSSEVLANEGARAYYESVFDFERVIFSQVERYRDNPQALGVLTEIVGSMDALLGALSKRYKNGDSLASRTELQATRRGNDFESGFEAFGERFRAYRGLMAVAFSLHDAGYHVALGDMYQDLALGMDLIVYATEIDLNQNRPCMFIDAKSKLGIPGENHSGVRVEDYLLFIDKKRDGRVMRDKYLQRLRDFSERRGGVNQYFTDEVPHLVINYPNRNYFADFYENSTLGLPRPDQAAAVQRLIKEYL